MPRTGCPPCDLAACDIPAAGWERDGQALLYDAAVREAPDEVTG